VIEIIKDITLSSYVVLDLCMDKSELTQIIFHLLNK